MFKSDTIAAISTAVNNSGIGIIRVSGSDAFDIASKIFVPYKNNEDIKNYNSHTIHYGNIVANDKVIDEVLVSFMKEPNTYTRENIIEINCHGGMVVVNKVLELVLKNGARCADPGEFTKRAFLNGRIDLAQAEAVINIINSKNDMALDISMNQLKGKISNKVNDIRSDILSKIAYIEAALDDPEHIEMNNYGDELKPFIIEKINELNKLLDTAQNGRIMTEGIKTVILGKPNAGKSSVLNQILGEDRAIVTDIAGTTRDTLEENIRLNGISLNIIDTAGIRDTEDIVEKIGVDKAKQLADEADLIIYVIDSSTELDENDYKIIDIIKDKKSIIILNKNDLDTIISIDDVRKIINKNIVSISAKNNTGFDTLSDEIKKMFYSGNVSYNDQIYITSMRHKQAICDTVTSLKCVIDSINSKVSEDFFTIDLMNAYESLGSIIGEQVGDDVVNEIFSKFCMGK